MTQNKNDSINSILQYGRVVEKKLLCGISYLRTSIFDTVSQKKTFEYENQSPAVKTSANYKKRHQTSRSMRKSKNNNFNILIRSISR